MKLQQITEAAAAASSRQMNRIALRWDSTFPLGVGTALLCLAIRHGFDYSAGFFELTRPIACCTSLLDALARNLLLLSKPHARISHRASHDQAGPQWSLTIDRENSAWIST